MFSDVRDAPSGPSEKAGCSAQGTLNPANGAGTKVTQRGENGATERWTLKLNMYIYWLLGFEASHWHYAMMGFRVLTEKPKEKLFESC